jgi:hypothetical protein
LFAAKNISRASARVCLLTLHRTWNCVAIFALLSANFLGWSSGSSVVSGLKVTIAHCKTYWFSESIQSKVLSEASTILKVMALQST